MHRLLAATAAVCLATLALAGPNTECPELPPDFAVDPWQTIRLGDLTLRIGLDYVPGGRGRPGGGVRRRPLARVGARERPRPHDGGAPSLTPTC